MKEAWSSYRSARQIQKWKWKIVEWAIRNKSKHCKVLYIGTSYCYPYTHCHAKRAYIMDMNTCSGYSDNAGSWITLMADTFCQPIQTGLLQYNTRKHFSTLLTASTCLGSPKLTVWPCTTILNFTCSTADEHYFTKRATGTNNNISPRPIQDLGHLICC